MPDESPKTNQEIVAGDGSHAYQAGRDLHVHHGGSTEQQQSSIVPPTNAQVAKFDPKVRLLLEKLSGSYRWHTGGSYLSFLIIPIVLSSVLFSDRIEQESWRLLVVVKSLLAQLAALLGLSP